MHVKIFISFIFLTLFMHGCCTTRTAPPTEIDRNFSELQNRIVELQNRNKNLEEEINRLSSENKFYAEYYQQTVAGVGTNIDSALESTDYLDERINKLLKNNYELERILWELTNQNNPIGNSNFYTNQVNSNIIRDFDSIGYWVWYKSLSN